MKKRNSGCCFLFVCLLFLLPGLYLIKDRIPDLETITGQLGNVREEIGEKIQEQIETVQSDNDTAEQSEEQRLEILAMGESDNGCSYYYWTLDEAGRVEYMKLLEAYRSMEETVDLSVDETNMKRLVKMVFADHPELFYAEQSYSYTAHSDWVRIHPRYTCTAEEKEARTLQIEQTVQEAFQSVSAEASVYGIIKAFYTFVVQTVDYDLNSSDNQNIYSSMVNRVSVCTGYAKELQYLLQRAGIQAMCVEGVTHTGEAHAWLIAYMDGEYYHIDPTFGDPTYQELEGEEMDAIPEILQIDYTYLCCDDETILMGRTISSDLEVPACQSGAYLYYPLNGLYFDYYSDAVLISFQESIDRGENYWEGQFADAASYQEMVNQLQAGTFANLVLANHPDWGSVRMRMSLREETCVVKIWY